MAAAADLDAGGVAAIAQRFGPGQGMLPRTPQKRTVKSGLPKGRPRFAISFHKIRRMNNLQSGIGAADVRSMAFSRCFALTRR
jgi:hypothetical protein